MEYTREVAQQVQMVNEGKQLCPVASKFGLLHAVCEQPHAVRFFFVPLCRDLLVRVVRYHRAMGEIEALSCDTLMSLLT